MKVKHLFRGVFNFSKQILVLYAHAFSEAQAKEIMLRRIADKHGVSLYWVRGLFNEKQDNFEISIEVEMKEV